MPFSTNRKADGVDNGCIVVAADKPKRPYHDPSALLATFKFKLILSNPNPSVAGNIQVQADLI